MQKETVYDLLGYYGFEETKNPNQFVNESGIHLTVGENIIVRKEDRIVLVTDDLEKLELFIFGNSDLSEIDRPDLYFPLTHGDLEFDEDFWDCECEEDFIHLKVIHQECSKCGAFAEDQPDSLRSEVWVSR
ncbi:hypothetical protein CH379_018060 [Leptospira ellisii]|uniref:Uncharacterized protein n=1 Tax=Leptospira ellisii TaxID=2023197 RepID=A0A2N0B8E9_9LEPT|nr:hypothetical protein [Leptospira ellisii]MDV6237541.1 hypothetical protein [Leptospira ellisii]PJZ92810.1 hypothetical protein CH379_11160 [Leptospira ellisii]PKA05192.1 hypothetical protein CH375_06590 [Leptospira ellisii]